MEHIRHTGVNVGAFAIACLVLAAPTAALVLPPGMLEKRMGAFNSQSNNQTVRGECQNRGPSWQGLCGKPFNKSRGAEPLHLSSDMSVWSTVGHGICSRYWQDYILVDIFDKIGTTNKYFLEFGAQTPENTNSAHFRFNCGWEGLLLDGAPALYVDPACSHCAIDAQILLNAPEGAPVRLRGAFLTPENVNDVFQQMRVPGSFDLLTVDIDGNEYWVLRGLDMNRFAPRVIAVKFSSYFSKDQVLVPKYQAHKIYHSPDVMGASLSALNRLLQSRGYSYVTQVAGEHAIWVQVAALREEDSGGAPIPERVNEGWQSAGGRFIAEDFQTPPNEGWEPSVNGLNNASVSIDSLFSLAKVSERPGDRPTLNYEAMTGA